MKKLGLLSVAVLLSLSLTACGSSSTTSSTKSSSSSSHKVVKHHKKTKHKQSQKDSSSSSDQSNSNQQSTNQGTQSSNQTQTSNTGHQLTQGEINRQRGYDPNGNPLLPGQDHAAGSNPDGTPDAWVQGQIDWEKQNGYLNPDGTETDKGRAANQEVENDASY